MTQSQPDHRLEKIQDLSAQFQALCQTISKNYNSDFEFTGDLDDIGLFEDFTELVGVMFQMKFLHDQISNNTIGA